MTHQWTLPASDPEKSLFLRTASAALTDAFGTRFEWWTRGQTAPPKNQSATDTPSGEDVAGEWNRLLDRCWSGEGEPQVVQCSDGECLLAIPVQRNRHSPCVATARFPASPDVTPHLLVKLAKSFQKALAQQNQLEQHEGEMAASAVQISEYMEELCFLRSMAERLELSEASHDVWQVAQSMLPLLGPIVKAETLALVAAHRERTSTPDTPGEVGGVVVWTGARWPGEKMCRRLVTRFRKEITGQPLVSNHFDTEHAVEFPGVGQLIIVPLLKGNQEMGWLLAINRLVTPTDENVPLGMSDLEFGTVEAGLLGSAASMLATQASNVELFVAKEGLLVGVVRAMVSALDAKDPYTCGHSERVALVGQRLARQLGLDERYCEQLYLTGLLHDIGKIGISDAVLSKPGKLSDQEFDEIKRHPDQGWLILHDLDPLNYVLPGVLHHHESYNGTGYPDRLAGDEIPLDARILAVADAYDAMSSDRPYRKGMPTEKVEAILKAGAGTQWDARVIEAFFGALPDIHAICASYRPRTIASRKSMQAESQATDQGNEDVAPSTEAIAAAPVSR